MPAKAWKGLLRSIPNSPWPIYPFIESIDILMILSRRRGSGESQGVFTKGDGKERLYIEAAYARRVEKDTDKEFRLLQEIAVKYSKEKEVHSSLFAAYQQKKMYPEAAAEANKALGSGS